MDHKEELEALHKQSLLKIENLMNAKENFPKEKHEALHQVKSEWEVAWNKLMETLLALEQLEI